MSVGQYNQAHTQAGIEGLEIDLIKSLSFLSLDSRLENTKTFLLVTVSSPGYDSASSRNEVPRIGISCISQVQVPWGRLPGNGQVFPEILV